MSPLDAPRGKVGAKNLVYSQFNVLEGVCQAVAMDFKYVMVHKHRNKCNFHTKCNKC